MIIRILLATIFLQSVTSIPQFRELIPNVNRVPYPCKPGQIWAEVGHLQQSGEGARNPFGLDFVKAGHKWTKKLCMQDSDGDGLTNGVELGDPQCNWTYGLNPTPSSQNKLSHPGICDPWDSPKCMARNLNSSKYKTQAEWLADLCGLDCPELKSSDVLSFPVEMNVRGVPNQPITIMCQIFDVSLLRIESWIDQHIVGVTPSIYNKDVVQYIVLYGCADKTPSTPLPYECQMKPDPTCDKYIFAWTKGMGKECLNPEAGIRIGGSGLQRIAIQVHWSNPTRDSTLVDGSGVRLHITNVLKTHDSGTLLVGATNFTLPPRSSEVVVRGLCSSNSTKQIVNAPVYLTSVINHMHFTGRKMKIELIRNNVVIKVLTDEQRYSLNTSVINYFSPQVELRPGDAIASTCQFDTSWRNATVKFGDALLDEMCYGYLAYYPKENIISSACVDRVVANVSNTPNIEGCPDLKTFEGAIETFLASIKIKHYCKPAPECSPMCGMIVSELARTQKCMQGNAWQYTQTKLAEYAKGQEFLRMISPCQQHVDL